MSSADLFISYRRADAGVAGRLSDWLGAHFGSDRVFMDVTGIVGGQDFPTVLIDAISRVQGGRGGSDAWMASRAW